MPRSAALVVLAVEENRRCQFVLDAAQRLGWPTPVVVGWRDALLDPSTLSAALERAGADESALLWLRVDSPGEDWDTERAMIAWGAEVRDADAPEAARIDAAGARALAFDRGRVRLSRQWYLGFQRALAMVAERVAAHGRAQITSAPEQIAALFDKRATHARFAERRVRTTPLLGAPRDSDELRAMMVREDAPRVFVKPWHGSSASGVVALRWDPTDASKVAATTSAELVEGEGEVRLYNSLRVRRYTDERDVRTVLDALCREGAIVERWLPKATYDGDNFDLRVVTIAGRARHAVVRVGRAPMTNLHLGNRRGDLGVLCARLGEQKWQRVREASEAAAAAFEACNTIGVDVMLSPNLQDVSIIEANAFGDLLPGVSHDGDDTYTAALRSLV